MPSSDLLVVELSSYFSCVRFPVLDWLGSRCLVWHVKTGDMLDHFELQDEDKDASAAVAAAGGTAVDPSTLVGVDRIRYEVRKQAVAARNNKDSEFWQLYAVAQTAKVKKQIDKILYAAGQSQPQKVSAIADLLQSVAPPIVAVAAASTSSTSTSLSQSANNAGYNLSAMAISSTATG